MKLNYKMLKNAALNMFERNCAINMKVDSSDSRTVKSSKSSNEQTDYIRLARITWEEGINDELRAIVSEAKRPFALQRYLDFPSTSRLSYSGNPKIRTSF